ncbi:MAG TPA: leucyl/phenylalanyl-tRNA--protein transferase [Dissulfurispiraceae bacterium]|nr:leucyl/phenylalanyl-tRNA--protein transferase [Dissulfurispiraceae bacterium]
MPIYRLPDELIFPPPYLSEPDGLLAVGGDLGPERLLLAYAQGIFPWYSQDSPILWWSPDPRLVLFPDELKISRSLRQLMQKGSFAVTYDTAFERVIRECAGVHADDKGGTWITEEMIEAYIRLHHEGFAHSIESWADGELTGGLYGVSIGAAFFGESMFARRNNASKVAFAALVKRLAAWGFSLIDCQVTTGHLVRFGAREIPRGTFLQLLDAALRAPTRRGLWAKTRDSEMDSRGEPHQP